MVLDPSMANLRPRWPTSIWEVGQRNHLKSLPLANLANLANLFRGHARARARVLGGPDRALLPLYLCFRLARLARLAKANQINGLPWPTSDRPVFRGWPGWPARPAVRRPLDQAGRGRGPIAGPSLGVGGYDSSGVHAFSSADFWGLTEHTEHGTAPNRTTDARSEHVAGWQPSRLPRNPVNPTADTGSLAKSRAAFTSQGGAGREGPAPAAARSLDQPSIHPACRAAHRR